MTALAIHLAVAPAAVCQTPGKPWPDNAKWPSLIDGVKLVLKSDFAEVALSSDRLSGRFRADEIRLVLDLADGDAFVPEPHHIRFIRFSATTGEVTVSPLPAGALIARSKDEYAATPPAVWQEFRPEERFAVLARIQRAGQPVWLAFAVSLRAAAPRTPVLSKLEYSPTFAPAQRLLDGRSRAVGRITFKETVSNILANQHGTWFDLVFDGAASTETLDPAAFGRLEFQVGRAFGPRSLDRLGFQLGVRSNQSRRKSAGYASFGATWVLPGEYARPSRLLIVGSAPVVSAGVRAEQRWKRDDDLSPYHIKPSLMYGFLRAKAGPLWLFPKDGRIGSFERDCALVLDLGAYWLPNDRSKPGLGTRPFESSIGVSVALPARVLIFAPELYFRSGAMEWHSFARTSVIGVGLTTRF